MFTRPQPLAVKVKIEAYSVIYDAEWHSRDYRVADVAPPNRRRWDLTEINSVDFADIFDRQRKWATILTPRRFSEFVDHVGLIAEDVETMGMLGAPGFGWGWAPAVSFQGDDQFAWQNAYVCPIPAGDPTDYMPSLSDDGMFPPTEAEIEAAHAMLWERVRCQVLGEWGNYNSQREYNDLL